LTGITALPQRIADRKTIVLKSRLDPTMAKQLGEKVKGKFFARFRFLKPRPEDIRLISVDKYYEPYIIVGGRYAIDYCKRRVYAIKVDDEMREIVITRKKFKPQPFSPERSSRVVKLEGEGHFHYEHATYFVLDRMGREVSHERIPFAPSEGQDLQKSAGVGIKIEKVAISREEEIDFLRSRIVNRPPGVEIIKEIFEVNERAMVCSPMYRLTFQNVKTEEAVTLKIDGITGEITPAKPVTGYMEDSAELYIENLPSVELKKVKSEPDFSKSPPAEESSKRRGKVAGGVFFVGDDVTAAVGDAAIPSGTTIVQNILVRGRLKVGADCRIYGNIEALKDIVIDANTKIDGNVTSGGKLVIGADSVIRGSVESGGVVEIAESAAVEGRLYSKSSVKLDQLAKISQKADAEGSEFMPKGGEGY